MPITVTRTFVWTFDDEDHRRLQMEPSLPDGEITLPNRTCVVVSSAPPQPDAGRRCWLPRELPHEADRAATETRFPLLGDGIDFAEVLGVSNRTGMGAVRERLFPYLREDEIAAFRSGDVTPGGEALIARIAELRARLAGRTL